MKKRSVRRVHHHPTHHKAPASENYLVVVRSWMFVVAFALMLGLGAMVGQFISTQIASSTPVVAGVTTAQ
ncbi:MAG: hypothetical protein NTY06_00700 [Candidatus Gottesmanbacteria bacterium]|nr:hypothetical protein [Candidatus Gottesmanbacteria bacterium]